MLAVAPDVLIGHEWPRIAPPVPARSDIASFRGTAAHLGYHLMPWQDIFGRYATALAPDDRWLFREVAIVVSRQNGKSTLLIPLIVDRLLKGQRIMHTAQNRDLPRALFAEIAELMWEHHQALFKTRNGRTMKPRYANGQEEIQLTNGGMYSIVAPTRGGARGPSRDLVIIDELREMDTWDFIAAAKPTLTASPNPQMLYLSNAGDDSSVVLNALRDRAGTDPGLAYLEWSAAPERASDDPLGWSESNPALGVEAEGMGSVYETLVAEHRTALLEGTMSLFETEHLCRWVATMRERLVNGEDFAACQAETLEKPRRAYMAVSMDPAGTRADAAIAWQQTDGTIALRLPLEGTGFPIHTDDLGKDLREVADRLGVRSVGFDPLTDAELAKFFRTTEPITAGKFANASARFEALVKARRLRWMDAAAVGDDLIWTARKPHDESGSFQAVRAKDDRPITASLAAIRAVWLASGPKSSSPKVL